MRFSPQSSYLSISHSGVFSQVHCLLLILLMHVSVISLTSYLICVGERKYLNEILYLYISLQYTNVLYSFYEYLLAQAELKIIIQ